LKGQLIPDEALSSLDCNNWLKNGISLTFTGLELFQ